MKHFPNSSLRIILKFLKVAYSTRVTLGLTVCSFPFHFVTKSKGVSLQLKNSLKICIKHFSLFSFQIHIHKQSFKRKQSFHIRSETEIYDILVMGESHDQIIPLSAPANSCCFHKTYDFPRKLYHQKAPVCITCLSFITQVK